MYKVIHNNIVVEETDNSALALFIAIALEKDGYYNIKIERVD